MPLANHISGPIRNAQSEGNNSTAALNTTTLWALLNDSNMVTTSSYNANYFKKPHSLLKLYGPEDLPHDATDLILSDVESYDDNSLDDNSTSDGCHTSNLESSVGKNSVKRIPARVWLTVSWIVTMCSIGRFV